MDLEMDRYKRYNGSSLSCHTGIGWWRRELSRLVLSIRIILKSREACGCEISPIKSGAPETSRSVLKVYKVGWHRSYHGAYQEGWPPRCSCVVISRVRSHLSLLSSIIFVNQFSSPWILFARLCLRLYLWSTHTINSLSLTQSRPIGFCIYFSLDVFCCSFVISYLVIHTTVVPVC